MRRPIKLKDLQTDSMSVRQCACQLIPRDIIKGSNQLHTVHDIISRDLLKSGGLPLTAHVQTTSRDYTRNQAVQTAHVRSQSCLYRGHGSVPHLPRTAVRRESR
jgi:hypothetical protein